MYLFIIKTLGLVILFLIAVSPLQSAGIAAGGPEITVISGKIDTTHQIFRVFEKNNVHLNKTAVFFDLDDTLFHSAVYHGGRVLPNINSADATEDYRSLFSDFSGYSALKASFSMGFHTLVEPQNIITVISDLRSQGAYVGICSKLPFNAEKGKLLKEIGFEEKDYLYAKGNKAAAIINCMAIWSNPLNYTTVVLIDNKADNLDGASRIMKKHSGIIRERGLNIKKFLCIRSDVVRNEMNKTLQLEFLFATNKITAENYDVLCALKSSTDEMPKDEFDVLLASMVATKTATETKEKEATAMSRDGASNSSAHTASSGGVLAAPASVSISLVSAAAVAAVVSPLSV